MQEQKKVDVVLSLTEHPSHRSTAIKRTVIESAFDDNQIMQQLADGADANGGEHAIDYPDLSSEAAAALGAEVRSVIARHLAKAPPPPWFTVEEERRVIVYVDEMGKGHVLPDDDDPEGDDEG